ncbi:hypothetical protein AYL99_11941 [Fonsecaea erecta]|uniref:Uncharacterized protein n=1 Tax=Fonsecaea erecta TaxID=1367422 RepID=A0A178Z2A1_9EURO|nr:hypothetical protein AYL99_11941 [Fonsecaea erecta]OAP53919.1 hypothetical protein AYL99_11941 [Fonsecaea erecta]
MTRRLSFLFSHTRDSTDNITPDPPPAVTASSPHIPPQSGGHPKYHKLHKHRIISSSAIDLNAGLPPLTPPPLLSDSGAVRPPTSHHSAPGSTSTSRKSGSKQESASDTDFVDTYRYDRLPAPCYHASVDKSSEKEESARQTAVH